MASAVSPLTGTTPAASASERNGVAKTPAPDQNVNKETFLKLLVAQIRNQNPLSPADGIHFVTQLAQFTELEQTISMRQSLDAIRNFLNAASQTEKPADGTTRAPGV